jgi:hypothetical protein
MTTTEIPVDNGVNVEALLGVRILTNPTGVTVDVR